MFVLDAYAVVRVAYSFGERDYVFPRFKLYLRSFRG